MSEPNYSYCALYCPGKILNCPHYNPASDRFAVCETYKLIDSIAPERKHTLSRKSLEKMVEAARNVRR